MEWPWNLVCSIKYPNPTKIVQTMTDPGLTLTLFRDKVEYGKLLIQRIS